MAGVSFAMASAIAIAIAATVSTLGECRLRKADGSPSQGSDGEYQAEARGTNDESDSHAHFSFTNFQRLWRSCRQIIAHYNIAEIPCCYTHWTYALGI
jgi:hypothetical protein